MPEKISTPEGARKLVSEFVGTAFLLATVVGSGIMGDNLSGGNDGIALLGNTLATGAILVVLILAFGPISGAHFNPAVTLVMYLKGDVSARLSAAYCLVQLVGAVTGVLLAHAMFDLPLHQLSEPQRYGGGQWLSEAIATLGLLMAILLTGRVNAGAVPFAVGLYITAGYWFTASTSFANPAVTLARSLSNTFSGIAPADAPLFILSQFVGAVLAFGLYRWLYSKPAD